MGWQPIETAPLDGTPVLLFIRGHCVVEANFSPGFWSDHHEYGREYNGPVWVCADDTFQVEVEEVPPEYGGMHHGQATHWMPLPAPPTQEHPGNAVTL